MCAIIGLYLKNRHSLTNSELNNLFRESSIRGLHATGVSWVGEGGAVNTLKLSVPAQDFPFDWDYWLSSEFRLVGHCRYSTSDLLYNQPITGSEGTLVHNGVITQSPPEEWEYECEGLNDSELLLRAIETGDEPVLKFPHSSIAAIYISGNRFFAIRNSKRPLWVFTLVDGSKVLLSTKDIGLKCLPSSATYTLMPVGTYNILDDRLEEIPLKHDLQDIWA